jgi:hypothetical protein
MKRVFGTIEVVFDIAYLIAALIISLILFANTSAGSPRMLAGIMGLVLVIGDAFHLIPRVMTVLTKREEQLRKALGYGKLITSITMTLFYLLLWHIGSVLFVPNISTGWNYLLYSLAIIRIVLCLLPQNKWQERYPPVSWGIIRNLPFFLIGVITAIMFFINRFEHIGLSLMWLAIALSFLFYLPVVLWANKNPKLGMLMLPKTCAYIWILIMCLSL